MNTGIPDVTNSLSDIDVAQTVLLIPQAPAVLLCLGAIFCYLLGVMTPMSFQGVQYLQVGINVGECQRVTHGILLCSTLCSVANSITNDVVKPCEPDPGDCVLYLP